MAYSKASQFHPHTYKQSLWSKALSHPARIMILSHLQAQGDTPFCTLAKIIPLAKTTVSQHIRILRQAGLLETYEVFPHTFYALHHQTCKDLAIHLENLNQSFVMDEPQNEQLSIPRSPG